MFKQLNCTFQYNSLFYVHKQKKMFTQNKYIFHTFYIYIIIIYIFFNSQQVRNKFMKKIFHFSAVVYKERQAILLRQPRMTGYKYFNQIICYIIDNIKSS